MSEGRPANDAADAAGVSRTSRRGRPDVADRGGRLPWWGRTWVRLWICFTALTTLPLTVTAIYTTHIHLSVVRSVAAQGAADRARAAAQSAQSGLNAARNDVLALADWPVLDSFLNSTDGPRHQASTDRRADEGEVPAEGASGHGAAAGGGGDASFWRSKLMVQLRTFVDLKPAYHSVAIEDEQGQVRARVERRGTTTEDDPPTASGRPFEGWLAGAYQSARRQTVVRSVPGSRSGMIEIASRVRTTPGKPRCVAILEVDLLDYLPLRGANLEGGRSIVIFGERPDVVVAAVGESADVSGPPGTEAHQPLLDSNGRLVNWAILEPNGEGTAPTWRLAWVEPGDVLEAGARGFRTAFLGVLGAALLLSAALGVWVARQYTSPLRALYEAAEQIGRGEFDVSLGDTTGDEIGALSVQVKKMAAQLRRSHEDMEAQLRAKAEQLLDAERLATIGRTAAAVAHEINNPSGIISLYAQMLTERLPPDDPNVAKLRVIDAKAREISQIVRELLDYARKPTPRREWIDITALIREASEAAMRGQTGAVAPPKLMIEGEAPRAYCDPSQLSRVVRNLLDNAYHAISNGSAPRVQCSCAADGALTLEVIDQGVGMSDEQLRHLFDPFYTTKRFGAGTGLGLAISKEIVERHGGVIEVRSREGEGTTVTLRLPGEDADLPE